MILSSILYLMGVVLLIGTLLPLIRSDYWIFRVFEYPRLQKWALTMVVMAGFLLTTPLTVWYQWAFVTALVFNFIYLSFQIYPFLPIAAVQMQAADPENGEAEFSIIIANVYQYNQEYARLVNLIQSKQPELIVLSETDQSWADAMEAIHEAYPYRISRVLDNTYGIMFFSKLEIVEGEIKYLVEKGIPSIFTLIRLPSGDEFRLICLHPKPPVPGESTRSTERDKEILLVGKMAKKSPIPVIVTGDLNDVAWSYTNALFQKTSGLLDPRRGRGFFNTFHAQHLLFRYPLDHIFCSSHFQCAEIDRLPDIGSDHFPMWVKLVYVPNQTREQQTPTADEDDIELANRKISKSTD